MRCGIIRAVELDLAHDRTVNAMPVSWQDRDYRYWNLRSPALRLWRRQRLNWANRLHSFRIYKVRGRAFEPINHQRQQGEFGA